MNLRITKKAVTIFMIAAIAVGYILYCISHQNPSPTKTVELYFKYFTSKESQKQDALLIDRLKNTYVEWDYLEYVELLSCYEDTHDNEISLEEIQRNWYVDAQYAAKVCVTFEIKFADNAPSQSGFSNGIYNWTYFLAKHSANEPWIIVSFGD